MSEITGKDLGLTSVRGRLLEVKEVSAFLRVSVRWIEAHMKDGTFPLNWYPIGLRGRVVDSADINDWLGSIKVSAGNVQLPKRAARKIKKEGANMQ